jgi:hypothetical protein
MIAGKPAEFGMIQTAQNRKRTRARILERRRNERMKVAKPHSSVNPPSIKNQSVLDEYHPPGLFWP